MPTYDYVCEACGHKFDHFQSMSSRKLRKCPECSKPKLVRLVGAGAGVIFKGSGFYETDYKRAGSSGSDGSSSKSGSGGDSKESGAKSDTSSSGESSGESSGDSPKSDSSSKEDSSAGSDK